MSISSQTSNSSEKAIREVLNFEFFSLQLFDSQILSPFVDYNQDSLTLTLSVGSLKGGGKIKCNSSREVC